MKREGLAVIVLGARGYALGERIADFLGNREIQIYAPAKLGCGKSYSSLKEQVAALFPRAGGLVFIMAVGIAVRLVAPHLKDKFYDPPVVAVDEAGRFAVSLIGGHHGGNALAVDVAAAVGACPVVTTASEVLDRPAVDLFAAQFNLSLEPEEHLAAVAQALVDGERVAILWDVDVPPVDYWWPPEVAVIPWGLKDGFPEGFAARMLITEKAVEDQPPAPFLLLRPRRYVAGIGCRRGTPKEKILAALKDAAAANGVPLCCLREMATVDLKMGEEGLHAAADNLGVPLRFFGVDALREVKAKLATGAVQQSAFVREKIGVGNVCELAAIAAGGERLVVRKTVFPGVTVAVAAVPWP
ncbi:MAG: cobalamin biosynthesis protein [Bacillota bacterium]